jgi:hypothetical protein
MLFQQNGHDRKKINKSGMEGPLKKCKVDKNTCEESGNNATGAERVHFDMDLQQDDFQDLAVLDSVTERIML